MPPSKPLHSERSVEVIEVSSDEDETRGQSRPQPLRSAALRATRKSTRLRAQGHLLDSQDAGSGDRHLTREGNSKQASTVAQDTKGDRGTRTTDESITKERFSSTTLVPAPFPYIPPLSCTPSPTRVTLSLPDTPSSPHLTPTLVKTSTSPATATSNIPLTQSTEGSDLPAQNLGKRKRTFSDVMRELGRVGRQARELENEILKRLVED
ncbi:uncharacterized protein STEHIDRAFT_116645 [Stereum hirsutum FP-91666 SS1]|uniref:Uncharacterized protein n=1 Tax=Stereum hirsutum (strain FP-91666) TaxID=721885 RepID=R7RY81_STEHR|nr:uncharacterized protein STEHIDRAFT_116645 [Stereum hirsutum FP-91666 SS1]EIM79307.1 hypothetical protein STEHIDRAFT_116645 [Stereum hirsutum FP-91666 SS1]